MSELSELYLTYDITNGRVLVTLPGTGEPIGYVELQHMAYGLDPQKNRIQIVVTTNIDCATSLSKHLVDKLLNRGDTL